MDKNFYSRLTEILPEDRIKEEEPMRLHTTFRVGGPARFFVMPKTAEELQGIIACCRETQVPYYIIGNGSNLLVSDQGYEGVVVQIFKEMNEIRIEGEEIVAQAGALLSAVAARAAEASLTGFEFAAGIPGTLGGACVMNAGAYGGEMKDILSSVRVMEREGQIRELPAHELALSYRHSCVPERGLTVLSARLTLRKGEEGKIRARMEELSAARREKQPLEYPSAGSTFKRPEGYFAGKLIQDAGLKGYSVGGAQVSEKHAGFVINRNQATPEDIRALIEEVQKRVWETSGVCLEPEVKFLGFENENRQQELFRGRQEADGAEKE